MIFDSHAHYDDEAFDEDRESLLDSMESRGIEYIVNVGTDLAGNKETLGMIKRFPLVYGALGFHPNNVDKITEEDFEWVKKRVFTPKIVAIGEIGLDYYWCKNDQGKSNQKEWFEKQIELAKESELPMSIHSRDAAADTLEILKSHKAGDIGGVIHCFSYGTDMAKEFLNMGLYIGIGGVITFKNSKKLKEVVAYMPLEKMVIETDCPYMSPEPNRGQRNTSLNLTYVVNEIANIKGIKPREVISATSKNAKKLFEINQLE